MKQEKKNRKEELPVKPWSQVDEPYSVPYQHGLKAYQRRINSLHSTAKKPVHALERLNTRALKEKRDDYVMDYSLGGFPYSRSASDFELVVFMARGEQQKTDD